MLPRSMLARSRFRYRILDCINLISTRVINLIGFAALTKLSSHYIPGKPEFFGLPGKSIIE
jgi:hypothetical protein